MSEAGIGSAPRAAIGTAKEGTLRVTLEHEPRRRGGGIKAAPLCAGGGMGSATVKEVAP